MPWRHVLRALIFPACCLAVNVLVFISSRMQSGVSFPARSHIALAAGLVAAACALVVAALTAGVSVMVQVARMSQAGRLPVFIAVRLTYRVARALNVLVGVGLLVACATPFVLVAPVAPSLVLPVLAPAIVSGIAVLMRVLAAGPRQEPDPVRLRGRAVNLEDAPAVRALVEPMARKVGVPPPRHLVLGLDPGVFCILRDVTVNEEVLVGGSLFLSLPMSRALDRGELAGLIAFEIGREGAFVGDSRQYIENVRRRASALLAHQPSDPVARAAFSGLFLPVRLWSDMLSGLDLAIWRGAAQAGAVVAGRETMASALAKLLLYPSAWGPFFSQLHRDVRESAFDESYSEDLSPRLASRCTELANAPDFLRPFESMEALNAAQPLLAVLTGSLGVAPRDVAARLRAAPADPTVDVIEGAGDIERELSTDIIRELRPAWPRRREPSSPEAQEAAANAIAAPPVLLQESDGEPRPLWDQRPMFTTGSGRRSHEGVILGLLFLLMALWFVWMVAEPLIDRAFPELWATKTGPEAFPVTVHLGDRGIAFTNGSASAWECTVEVGFPHVTTSYIATFAVEPRQTREVPYLAFREGVPNTDDSMVRGAARGRGSIECSEPSGTTHTWGW
jgi:hypothetical protein